MMQDIQFSAGHAGVAFSTFGWMYDSARFWSTTKKKGFSIFDERKDLATIRAVSKEYLELMEANGVDVDKEIPLVKLPVEEESEDDEEASGSARDVARRGWRDSYSMLLALNLGIIIFFELI